MTFQELNISIIPKGDIPSYYAKQYETGRPIIIKLLDDNGDAFNPDLTDIIKLNCRKVDDNIVIIAPDSVSGNTITFITTEQLTACCGDNLCELRITDNEEKEIATINFILHVQKMPTVGGLDSESQIDDLSNQITTICNEIVPGVVEEVAEPIVNQVAQQYANYFGGTWYTDNEGLSDQEDHVTIVIRGDRRNNLIDFYVENMSTFKVMTITNVTWSYNSNTNRTTLTVYYDPATVNNGDKFWCRLYQLW